MQTSSNKAKGDANYDTLVAYFDRVGASIPRKPDGSADIARIVKDAPLPARGVLYQNKRNRELCNQRFAQHGIPEIGAKLDGNDATFQRPGATDPDEEKRLLRRRNDQLERELTIARSEIIELRRTMRRFEAIDMHLAETGLLPR